MGTTNSNEILILKVHRKKEASASTAEGEEGHGDNQRGGDPRKTGTTPEEDETDESPGGTSGVPTKSSGGGESGIIVDTSAAIGLELCRSKQLVSTCALSNRWQPDLSAPGVFSGASCGKIDREPHARPLGQPPGSRAGGGGLPNSSGRTGGGGTPASSGYPAAPFSSKASPGRSRARSLVHETTGYHERATGAAFSNHAADEFPAASLSRSPSKGAMKNDSAFGGDAGAAGDRGGRGSGRDGVGGGGFGKEVWRCTGASCMRFSPSGSHLAIGCRSGSLVIMAVDGGARGDDGDVDLSEADEGVRRGDRKDGRGFDDAWGGDDGGQRGRGDHRRGVDSRLDRGADGRSCSYRRVAHLKGHASRVLHLDWSTDGRFVHTCGQDYQILHWEIVPSQGTSAGFRPCMFQRAFLLRDIPWATWSSTVGWPVQVWDFPPGRAEGGGGVSS